MLGLGKKEDLSDDKAGKAPEEAKIEETPVTENEEVMDLSGEDMTEEPRVYEVSYLIVPGITEEEAGAEAAKVKALATGRGGESIADGAPKKITLAYPVVSSISNKNTTYTDAYFGWTKFTLEQEKINEVKEELDKNTNIVRFLIIKTTKETHVIKPAPRRVYKKKDEEPKVTKEEGKGPVDEKELDKEIEGLLVN
ncbi:hypothetical protein CL654_03195 [bacterium]|nr:hypothetical protein [bacterium]|tara:strand:+ start:26500 stop:27087 length:588 start_codon:yes stop_codon:yes gene_type:complete